MVYKKHIHCEDYKTLDIENIVRPDFCEDIHETSLDSDSFDTILMVEVLEHLYNPFKAIEQVHRILKPGGRVIATTPFIHPYHGVPNDYFRYTKYGLQEIFKGFSEVQIIEYGNVFGASMDIITSYRLFRLFRLFNVFINNRVLNIFSKDTPTGSLVIAKH